MIASFSLERVNKAPASFDAKKLFAFQDRYMQQVPVGQKVSMVLPFLQQGGLVASPHKDSETRLVVQVLEAAGDRIKVAGDILDYAFCFVAEDRLTYDDKAFDKRIRKPAEARGLLAKFKRRLAAVAVFDATSLEKLLQDFVQAEGVETGQIIHALRVAVTGKAVGFGLFESLAVLGQKSSVARIERALGQA
jgi:glutamyl-tRNA synthetase